MQLTKKKKVAKKEEKTAEVEENASMAHVVVDETHFESDNGEDSDDEKQLQETGDFYIKQFGEAVSAALNEKQAIVDEKKWLSKVSSSQILECVQSFFIGEEKKSQSPLMWKNFIKQKLHEPWMKLKKPYLENGSHDASELQKELLSSMASYQDVLFSRQNQENTLELRHIYVLHALSHVYKTRDRILKNNAKIKASLAEGKEEDIRDQGFTRPRVLVLTPMRNSALEIGKLIMELSGTTQMDNKKRFLDEFGVAQDEPQSHGSKPEDYQNLFHGNMDDCYTIGIRLSRKAMKFYSPLYTSDIIMASPLGLRMIVGAKGDKKRDFDFLSSIEMVILDQSDVFQMQNWSHVDHIFDHLNLIPKDAHDCDFSRVKEWYLDGKAKYLRQTIVLASFMTPEINSLFNKSKNISGRVRIRSNVAQSGALAQVFNPIPQVFQRIQAASALEVDDIRFEFFIEKVLKSFNQKGLAIYIPSYFDFVRIRNYLRQKEMNFGILSEYCKNSDISRVRTAFFKGELDLVLITERFHFFKRYRIRGIKHIIFYAPPMYPHFYPEITNTIDEDQGTCTVLFTKYDKLSLERILGRKTEKVLQSKKDIMMFTA